MAVVAEAFPEGGETFFRARAKPERAAYAALFTTVFLSPPLVTVVMSVTQVWR